MKQDYDKWVETHYSEGFGRGRFLEYKSWLEQKSFSSKGYTNIVQGITVPRNYILFSDLERFAFRIIDYRDETIDVLEQVPLIDRNLSSLVATDLKIKHPKYKNTQTDIVMTTDFLVFTLKEGKEIPIAYTIKPAKELEKLRVIEKFAIEQEYWWRKGIKEYRIITETDINKDLARNIESLAVFKDLDRVVNLENFNPDERKELADSMEQQFKNWSGTPRQFCKRFEDQYALAYGTGIPLLKHLVFNKRIKIDLTKPLSFEKPWKLL